MRLLNEYQKGLNEKEENKKHCEIYERRAGVCDIYMNDLDDPYEGLNMYGGYAKARLISKQFGFIEWLVQNDKINTDELLGIYWETSQSIWEKNKYKLYSEYKRLLMLLALQDDPIEFLISVLK